MTYTCSQCRHWNKRPRDPNNLAAPLMGECRAVPPVAVAMGPQLITLYPVTVEQFPACGVFKASKLSDERVISGQDPMTELRSKLNGSD